MSDSVNPVVRVLTGDLPFLLLLSAVFTWLVAMGLLSRYRRSVRRSMARRANELAAPSALPGSESPHHALPAAVGGIVNLDGTCPTPARGDAELLLRRLLVRPWRAAAVYAAAGGIYALLMTLALLTAEGVEVVPSRFLMLFWIFLWPLVLAIGIEAAAVRSAKALVTAVYFAVLGAIFALVLPRNPQVTGWELVVVWVLYDLPATLVLLTYLSRPVRAVGPLVLTFLFLALLGSDVALMIAGSKQSHVQAVGNVASAFGIGAAGAFIGLLVAGFMVFALFGWLALTWIRRRYEAKRLSDESLTVDSLWLLFTAIYSVSLVFAHPAWGLAGVGVFAAYKLCVRIGFSVLRGGRAPGKSPRLLLLRSFSIGKDSERLFDALQKHWRRVGSIQLIAGVDLATRTVEPHEFIDFLTGKLARRFIDGPGKLARRMEELDTVPDRDGRFRVNDFFCYDDTWKMVLSRLVHESDAVLMDLRGFSPRNKGCVFEIRELVNLVPLERVVFITDERTDEPLLRACVSDAVRAMEPASPNRAAPACQAGVFRLASMTHRELQRLLRAVAEAAAPRAVGAH